VYRRVQRHHVSRSGQIDYKAFRPGLDDAGGLSVDQDLATAIANLRATNAALAPRRFLLAGLDVARIRAETVAWVAASKVSHTRIENCTDLITQQGLADIAGIVPVR
jgi:hypothetical protein